MVAVGVDLGGVGPTATAVVESGRVHLGLAGSGSWLATVEEWAIPVCGSVIATELVGRVIATRSPGVARGSCLAAGSIYITLGLIPVLIGLLGASLMPGLAESEQIIPALAQELLPPFVYVVFAGSLISAILSTVDSTLLIASGLLSHNVVAPMLGTSDEARKVLLARGGVVLLGIIAYLLAVRADGVLALVEQASAFGSAGALVTVVFALFTPLGGPKTAMATLLVGVVSYLVASYGGFAYPFLLSLGSALGTYLLGSAIERGQPIGTTAPGHT